ncbi:MAG: radical SAM protein [Paludibacteraceae bacterium]|nr:radical SAM protein [Paludibacteraceae bacterium]
MLFSEIVYGPIHSRRLGVSLGMNLMPLDAKLCSFNCIYCECGFNRPVSHPLLPSRTEVKAALECKLQNLSGAAGLSAERPSLCERSGLIDVITFSGNGEPTMHPEFEGIIEDTCALRDRYCPQAKVSVLSNATQLGREDVVRALWRCDNRILKLDSAIDATMHAIDDPVNPHLTVNDIIGKLQAFHGDFTLQTCFLRGTLPDGQTVDNTTAEELDAWYKTVRLLRPKQVMIYVIDRATPVKTLEKLSREQMERIAAPLIAEGMNVQISA